MVGRLIRELRKKIEESFDEDVVVAVKAILVTVTEPGKEPKNVTLVVHEKTPT